MTGFLEVVGLLKLIIPIISSLISLLKKTPEQKRAELIDSIHKAVKHAIETGGDTSDIERILRKP